MLWTATRVELRKIFAQRGTYAGFVVMGALVGLIAWGLWARAPEISERHSQFAPELLVAGKMVSAPFVMQWVLPVSMEILMPLLVAAVAGGLIAGEVRAGTMRTLLLRPITRLQLLVAKILASWLFTICLCAFVLLAAAAVSYALFGPGDLWSFFGAGLVLFGHREAVERLLLSYGLAALGRCVLATLAVMFSCLFDNPLSAAALTVAFLLGFGALEQLPYFAPYKPYFLTYHLDIYRLPLHADLPWAEVGHRLAGLAVYGLAAFLVSAWAFCRRDIS
jgi:ABC-2 type transport system permease protein